MEEYRLNTVTYGLACAPFLAIRTLHQLASDEKRRFPEEAFVLRHDMYVDDILSGSATLEGARELRTQVTRLCMAGGFPLRKWEAKDARILADVPVECLARPGSRAWPPLQGHSTLGFAGHCMAPRLG